MEIKSISIQRKVWIGLLSFFTIMFLAVFILSIVYSDEFYYGIKSESILATILCAILCLECVIERKAKYIYPATFSVYLIVTLSLRFFMPNVDLLVSPVISWGSVVLIVFTVLTTIVMILKTNKQINK